jgi:hypothetical protein
LNCLDPGCQWLAVSTRRLLLEQTLIKKVILILLAILVFGYGYLAFIGIEPKDRRPGSRFSGVSTTLPEDVAFLDDVSEVTLETKPWYGIPFFVTTVVVSFDGSTYLPSL